MSLIFRDIIYLIAVSLIFHNELDINLTWLSRCRVDQFYVLGPLMSKHIYLNLITLTFALHQFDLAY